MLQLAVTADAFAVPRSRSPLALTRRASLPEYVASPDGDRKLVLRDGNLRIGFGSGDLEGNPHFAIASPDPIEVWCDGSYDPRTESGGASSGRWLMQAHIPEKHRFGRPMEATSVDAEWIAGHLGLYGLLQRFELWPSWYPPTSINGKLTEYGPPPPRQVRVFSDYKPLVEWCNRWLSGKPVKRPSSKHILSTLEILEEFYTHGVDVTFEWVKSRSGLALHDLADELAREASVVNKENLYAHYVCRVE